jgi:Lon-like ATP-dependent protease
VQFLQTYEGVEGDSASIAVAVAIISALKKLPVKQDYAITGSLTVRGEVLPIGGVSYKIEAAIEAGIKNIIVPQSNMNDIVIDPEKLKKIKIFPVKRIEDVLKMIIVWDGNSSILKDMLKK